MARGIWEFIRSAKSTTLDIIAGSRMGAFSNFMEKLGRKKTLETDIMETPLKRCLTLFDLMLLGVGHMVGAGIYVITGTVVKDIAGPGIILSYLLAGFAAGLSSLCYAEFGARVPKAGSAYTYSYVTIGEFCAFMVGWNMILESLIGAASVARAWSGSFDSLFNGAIQNGTLEYIGSMNVPWLSHYPDFLALGVVLLVAVFIAVGAKASTNFNSVLTIINMVILSLIIGLGFYFADLNNWTNETNKGFLPYGFAGVIAGAGSCFYAYVGFEGIAIAGEEAKNPSRTIPLATGIAVLIVTFLYLGTSASLTLMVPYTDVHIAAPFPAALAFHGATWAKYVVAVGALVGLSTSILGSLFSLPRSVYAMAADGLFFRPFAYVHPKTQTPLLSILVFGVAAGLIALLVDLEVLVELLSIGTLLCFTIVAVSVIVLHYQPVSKCQFQLKPDISTYSIDQEQEEKEEQNADTAAAAADKKKLIKSSQSHDDIGKLKTYFLSLPLFKSLPPGYGGIVGVCSLTVFIFAFWLLVLFGYEHIMQAAWWSIILLIIFSLGLIASFFMLCVHEQNKSFVTFQVRIFICFSWKIDCIHSYRHGTYAHYHYIVYGMWFKTLDRIKVRLTLCGKDNGRKDWQLPVLHGDIVRLFLLHGEFQVAIGSILKFITNLLPFLLSTDGIPCTCRDMHASTRRYRQGPGLLNLASLMYGFNEDSLIYIDGSVQIAHIPWQDRDFTRLT